MPLAILAKKAQYAAPVLNPEWNLGNVFMSPIGHLQFGWWFAHWGKFGRRERAIIALAGAGPDLDGLSLLAGGDAFLKYHHILFHNVGAMAGAAVVASALLWRSPKALLLAVFAFAMHVVEDYITVGWNQHPWLPFSAAAVNLADHLPNWVVQGAFQYTAMAFIVGMSVWIYLKHQRTPLEIVSPALDRLLVNYAVLPWRHRCVQCSSRAHFHCDRCGRNFCSSHSRVGGRLAVTCSECRTRP